MRAAYGVTPARSVRTGTCVSSSAACGYIYDVIATAIAVRGGNYRDRSSPHEVCRGTDPRCYHDWAKDKREGNRVLIYTRTAGPRHSNLGPPLAAGLNPALDPGNVVQSSLRTWLGRAGIEADWTEDVTRLTNLHRYKAVIFASTSRDALFAHGRAIDRRSRSTPAPAASLDAAKTALRQYIRAGGGFVGIHNAFGTEYNWPWYEGLLGNTNFYDHGAHQNGTVKIARKRSVH